MDRVQMRKELYFRCILIGYQEEKSNKCKDCRNNIKRKKYTKHNKERKSNEKQ